MSTIQTVLRSIVYSCVCIFFQIPDAIAQETNQSVEWGLEYTGDMVGNASGGLKQGTVYLGNLNATALFDGASLWGIEGSTVYLYGLGNHGGQPSSLVGDAQTVDNIEANNTFRLYEAWIEHVFSGSRLSLLAGLMDVNAEFDSRETTGLFINSSHGIGPDFSQSGENGPSIFPVTSLGVRAKWAISSSMYLQTALLDGVPGNPAKPNGTRILFGKNDGLLSVTEMGYVQGESFPSHRRMDDQSHDLRAAIGFWKYTTKSTPILTGTSTSNWGVYAMVEKSVFSEPQSTGGLNSFARSGFAESSVNRFGVYVSTGAIYTGPFQGRDEDQMGLAIAVAVNTDDYRTAQNELSLHADAAESNIEFSYYAPISSHISVQFDVQCVINPDTNPELRNALVGMLRWKIAL